MGLSPLPPPSLVLPHWASTRATITPRAHQPITGCTPTTGTSTWATLTTGHIQHQGHTTGPILMGLSPPGSPLASTAASTCSTSSAWPPTSGPPHFWGPYLHLMEFHWMFSESRDKIPLLSSTSTYKMLVKTWVHAHRTAFESPFSMFFFCVKISSGNLAARFPGNNFTEHFEFNLH
jgi:hypothetical protein